MTLIILDKPWWIFPHGMKKLEYYVSLSAVFSISCMRHAYEKRLTQTMIKSRQVQALVKYRHRPKAIHLSIISMKKSTANTKLTIFRINISWVMLSKRGERERRKKIVILLWKCFHAENRDAHKTLCALKSREKWKFSGKIWD